VTIRHQPRPSEQLLQHGDTLTRGDTRRGMTPLCHIALLYLLLCSHCSAQNLDGDFTLPKDYSKYYRPLKNQDDQMRISTGLVITQIVDIDFEEKSLNMDVEFILKWTDQHIQLSPGYGGKVRVQNISEIWSPDLYIYNLKSETRRASSSVWLEKNKDGNVEVDYVYEANIIIQCEPDFKEFPFHQQICYLNVTSWMMEEHMIQFIANYDYADKLVVPDTFGYSLNMILFNGIGTGVKDPGAKFHIAGIKMVMTSVYHKYLLLYYVPTFMITITSWFFYLLPSTSYPARTALLMTAFLLLVQIYNSVVNETPNSDDITILELWTLICVCTVFATLLTYAIILGRDQMIIQGLILNDEGELEEEDNRNDLKKPKSAWSDSNHFNNFSKNQPMTRKHVVLELSMFLMVFSAFAGFNIWYWFIRVWDLAAFK